MGKYGKGMKMKRTLLLTLTTASLLIALPALAAVPYTFSAGTPARAASVNADFSALDNSLPGAAAARPSIKTLTASGANDICGSCSITVPGAGYIFASADLTVDINHTSGTASICRFSVDHSSTINGATDAWTALSSSSQTGLYSFTTGWSGVFPVASAGTYKYYLVGNQFNAGPIISTYHPALSLIFIPKALGTVTSAASEIAPLGNADAGREDRLVQ